LEQSRLIGSLPGKAGQFYHLGRVLVIEARQEISQAITQLAQGAGLDRPPGIAARNRSPVVAVIVIVTGRCMN
jgi:hypothetical protein